MASISIELSDLFFNYDHERNENGIISQDAGISFHRSYNKIIPELHLVSPEDLINDFDSRV